MDNCIFCRIVNGELPCCKIYEDEKIISFLDVRPTAPGHALILPKIHVATFEEASEADLSALILIVKKVGQLLKDKLDVSGYNIIVNNDHAAGQEIPHLHFHLIPRRADDGLRLFPQDSYDEGEAEDILKKLLA